MKRSAELVPFSLARLLSLGIRLRLNLYNYPSALLRIASSHIGCISRKTLQKYNKNLCTPNNGNASEKLSESSETFLSKKIRSETRTEIYLDNSELMAFMNTSANFFCLLDGHFSIRSFIHPPFLLLMLLPTSLHSISFFVNFSALILL